jgi:hypothetical protein
MHVLNLYLKNHSFSFRNFEWALGLVSMSNHSVSVSFIKKTKHLLFYSLNDILFDLDKPYICVFVKGSDESLANFIAFFTHTGQLQMKVEYDHRYTLRQLICDESSKGNCICMY